MEAHDPHDFDWAHDPDWEAVADRWGASGEQVPFVGVPFDLLRLQSKLGLTSNELVVLLNLSAHRWKEGQVVYPSNATLAKRMGLNTQTIQRVLKGLLDVGVIRKITHPAGGRAFDLSPLNERLKGAKE